MTPNFETLHSNMSGYIHRGDVPGLVTLVSHGGNMDIHAIGVTSLDGDQPMQPDTIFRIASMSKPITAAAVMLLVDEGKLDLDAPVDPFLPELANRRVLRTLASPLDDTVPAHRPITTRDLLAFTFGFGILMVRPGTYPIQMAMLDLGLRMGAPFPQEQAAPDQWIRDLGSLPLMSQPGERWLYDIGSDILGVLIARVSGQPFDQFLHKRLFQPLGMPDTAFSVPPEKLSRFQPNYSRVGPARVLSLYDPPKGQWATPPAFPSGGAGLVSTASDYHAFARMLLNHGIHNGQRLLSTKAVQEMTSDQLTPAQKSISGLDPSDFDHQGWGFGVSVVTSPEHPSEPLGSYGWSGGLGTVWRNAPAANPEDEIIAILLTQCAWTSPIPPPVAQDFIASVFPH